MVVQNAVVAVLVQGGSHSAQVTDPGVTKWRSSCNALICPICV